MNEKPMKYYGKKLREELTESEKNFIKEYKERTLRWQFRRIDLLTFSVNLLFTVTVASAGFVLNNLKSEYFIDKKCLGDCSLARTVLFILSISATVGIIGLTVRLFDFRTSAHVVRLRRRVYELKNDIRYEAKEESELRTVLKEIDNKKCLSTVYGHTTWWLFFIQAGLFLMAIWLTILTV